MLAVSDPAAVPGPAERYSVIDESEMSVTRQAFDRLSDDQRQCLILARVDGWSYREIAARLGTSEVTARVRVHRALKELKSIIETLSGVES